MSNVAVIGAGRMGMPMVSRLVDAGHRVSALGRRREVSERITAAGARASSEISDVVTGDTDVVLIVVLTDEQVRDVCLAGDLLGRMQASATIVVHTTGSPSTVEAIAKSAAPHGISVIDGAVSGGPHDIAAGTLTIFAGGDESTVDAVKPVLRAYAEPIMHVGGLGSGQRVKLVNNAMFAAQIGLARAGVELAARLGVDEATLLAALPNASANSRALSGIARYGSVDAFTEGVWEFVGKDIEVVRTVTAELGGDLGDLSPLIPSR